MKLTDDELSTALIAAIFYRDAKLQQRRALPVPPALPRASELFPPDVVLPPLTPDASTLDGQIVRAELLVSVLQIEMMHRDQSKRTLYHAWPESDKQ